MTSSRPVRHAFHRHADVLAALAEPHVIPVPATDRTAPPGTVAWLRATVARFSSGADHARRRALVEADLALLEPARLRLAAAGAPAGADPRTTVVEVLAGALELPEPAAVARAVAAVAAAYFACGEGEQDGAGTAPAAGKDGEADAAVAWLMPRVVPEGSGPEAAANRIGLLVQAYDATGRLVGHARRRPAGSGDLLADTLRHDPPVREIRRVAAADVEIAGTAIARGDLVVLDLAAAHRDPAAPAAAGAGSDGQPSDPPLLAFGAAPRVCPGRDHALALAAGILGLSAEPAAAPAPSPAPATAPGPGRGTAPGHDTAGEPATASSAGDDQVEDDPAEEGPADDEAADDRDPAVLLAAMIDRFLALAETWTAWDGRPVPIDDRVYTPHKSIRRIADHLVDHLAELEARLVGEEPQPDHWHASATTTEADLAPFTEEDLDEARSRLTRLTRIWVARLGSLTPEQLHHSPGPGWTFRRLALHLTGSIYYAEAIGDLRAAAAPNMPAR